MRLKPAQHSKQLEESGEKFPEKVEKQLAEKNADQMGGRSLPSFTCEKNSEIKYILLCYKINIDIQSLALTVHPAYEFVCPSLCVKGVR